MTGERHDLDGISSTRGRGRVAHCSCGHSYYAPADTGGRQTLVDWAVDLIDEATTEAARAKWQTHHDAAHTRVIPALARNTPGWLETNTRVCAWLEANGINPRTVSAQKPITVDPVARTITYTHVHRDPTGATPADLQPSTVVPLLVDVDKETP